jgi:hypothetical protein
MTQSNTENMSKSLLVTGIKYTGSAEPARPSQPGQPTCRCATMVQELKVYFAALKRQDAREKAAELAAASVSLLYV